MRFPKHVSLTWNPVLFYDWVPVLMSLHSAILYFPPVEIVPESFWPYLELVTPMWWPPGALFRKHAFTENVLHQGFRFGLKGHDCGPVIPHVCIGIECGLTIVHTLLSSRTVKYFAGEIKSNGTPVGMSVFFDLSLLPTPMMICGGPP